MSHMENNNGGNSACEESAAFALQVLGDSMEPEFMDGAIIIVDPSVPLHQNCYVVIDYNGETTFRQFVVRGDDHYLVALNDNYPEVKLEGEYNIRGVISQQARSRKLGIRKARHYI